MMLKNGPWSTLCASALLLSLCSFEALASEQGKKAKSPKPAAAEKTVAYWVKPSEVAIPAGVKPGDFMRMTRPFPNWTLICDVNFALKQKTCNITQDIANAAGATVFSWSLAATQEGQPLMILRVPPSVAGPVRIDIADGKPPISVPIKGCNAQLCLGYVLLDSRLRAAIEKGNAAGISYALKTSGTPARVGFGAPLAGLASALNAI